MKQNYFLGGTSPSGFRTRFSEMINNPEYYTYILKGGPGTGKSTLMKKISEACDDSSCEIFYCSSDIRSLDAVVLKDKKIIILDGTSPHTFDPELPGISQEIINLGDFWDKEKLIPHKEMIKYCMQENSKHHKRAARYISSAGSLCENLYNTALPALKTEKADSFSERFASRLTATVQKSSFAPPVYRQLSAFTSYGYVTRDLPENYTVYHLNDNYFAAAERFIETVSQRLSEHGITPVISECSVFDGSIAEHLIIPELSTAFISSGFFTGIKNSNSPSVNLERFYERRKLSGKKNQTSFSKKIISEICKAASEEIDTALNIHDEIEKYYSDSLDKIRLNTFTEKFIKKIV